MGLDGVELVMEVEDEFEIAITNEEAEKCETPGQLTETWSFLNSKNLLMKRVLPNMDFIRLERR